MDVYVLTWLCLRWSIGGPRPPRARLRHSPWEGGRSAAEYLRGEDRRVARVIQAHARDGHAGGHLHDREDRVEAAGGAQATRQRHADHGQVGVGCDGARQRGGDAGAGDDHAQAAHVRVLRVFGHNVRFAMGGHDANLMHDAPLLELVRGLLHRLHVALGAHHDADEGRVDVDVVELRLYFGLAHRLGHERDTWLTCRATLHAVNVTETR